MSPATQSMLETAGPRADPIARLFDTYLVVCGAVYLLVVLALAVALLRRPVVDDAARRERATSAVGVAVGATVVILIGLLVATLAAGKEIARPLAAREALTVEVSARQWWWRVTYDAPVPADRVTTANELHIPVGRPVKVRLRSADVIHSFWVPALHGKRDVIPGHDSEIVLHADRPGRFRGQCSEFCGYQHANMALWVVALPGDEFDAWLDAARRPAEVPTAPLARRGFEVFMRGQCPMCHGIVGTDAAAGSGPDLTHIASRLTLAAGTLPNVRGHLAGWILDPQSRKPGTQMPAISLSGEDLQALLAFLETLR